MGAVGKIGTAGEIGAAFERAGLEGVESGAYIAESKAAESIANADKTAAEALKAEEPSPKITIIGTEPVEPLPAGGAPYVSAEQAKVGESLAAASSYTSSWPEMRAQFLDKKLPTTDFKMTVNGEVLHSVSEPGKGAAIFRVKSEEDVFHIFKTMTGAVEMPKPRVMPKGILYNYTMEDGTKVALRNYADSVTGAKWTIDFAKAPGIKASKVEVKFIHD